ncbi:hypothetical protein KZJ38_07100 [Paraburkholderia edwinii]|jgi:hypothetical protein|uniref:SMODS and SLOG-associating 2TM effector domain-containing protein n=1 Tax=Paraburkholderia edwinii TaxID=2861782 RepID=A0ABX8UM59_9BURK|nr:hypothetical protein [Paraburkholderia edwinii]QYD70071.1 hypothetical protein KZJ38_07100 [Paraburkholderia edwinii]
MRWSDLADTVARHAPLIGSALRSPETNARPVHAIVASITGTAIDDPAAAAAAIAADSSLLESLRAAEAQSRPDLVAYVLRMGGGAGVVAPALNANAALGGVQPGFWKNLGFMRYAAHLRNNDRLRSKYFFMRPLLTAAVVIATIIVVFVVLLGFADHALHDPSIAATAGCVLMYFMSEARLVTAYWFGATHESRDANALARLLEMRERRERIEGVEGLEGREVVAREVEEFVDQREAEEKLIERSALGELPRAERTAAELFELRTPRG